MDRTHGVQRRTLVKGIAWVLGINGFGLTPLLSGCSSTRLSASEQGVVDLEGDVFLDGARLKPGMTLVPGGVIHTGKGARLTFVMGADAFLVRELSELLLLPRPLAMGEPEHVSDAEPPGGTGVKVAAHSSLGFTLKGGGVLAVFSPGLRTLKTPNAVIGIRGTAAYLSYQRERTYLCTCYGRADIRSVKDPTLQDTVTTIHHESPRTIQDDASGRASSEKAPMIDHTDEELILLEGLVGRRPPFLQSSFSSSNHRY
ncbi:MAG: hypothetical protein HQL79_02530 [Magnetococcales bacterium]|nr:hypothetical protein [Magnetococcales bacterium]